MQLTPQQQQCVDVRGGPVLISAAAGSGKTAVLVRHILSLLCDEQDPVDIDRMLIVTFTRAAAAEMRERLQRALQQEIKQRPQDARLRRQQLLLPRAHIGTIDSFCRYLLSEYGYLLTDVPLHMINSEEQAGALLEETIQDTVDDAFSEKPQRLHALATALRHDHKRKSIHDALRKIHYFLDSSANPQQWLHQQRQIGPEGIRRLQRLWAQDALKRARHCLAMAASNAQWAVRHQLQAVLHLMQNAPREELPLLCKDLETLGAHVKDTADLLRSFEALTKDISEQSDTEELLAHLSQLQKLPVRLGAWRCPKSLERYAADLIEPIKMRRDAVKTHLRSIAEICTAPPTEDDASLASVQALVDLAQQTEKAFTERKYKHRISTFSDVAHLALRLLTEQDQNGNLLPSALSRELSQRFRCVLVDEYQDVSQLQDTLFYFLSDEGKNLYMVGDVKQSIYGFRQARPQLFLRRYEQYADYDATAFPARILLNRNFRSRASVTDATNFICKQIMTPNSCGLSYGEAEQLYPSALFPDGGQADTACLLLTEQQEQNGSLQESEARSIAHCILEQLPVKQIAENGALRPMRLRDICILLRNRTHIPIYQQVLEQAGIAVIADNGLSFMETPAVTTVLSLLRCINNPTADIPMAAVLLSPLFGFTLDDLTHLRRLFPKQNLYTALRQAENAADALPQSLILRCSRFVQRLSVWRRLAQTESVYRLLTALYDDCALAAVLGGKDPQQAFCLEQLSEHVRTFDANGFKGLSAYLRRLDRTDLSKLKTAQPSAQNDAVQITVIHQSKGLEYPIVFLADTACAINKNDLHASVLLHAEGGLGISPFCEQSYTHTAGFAYTHTARLIEADLLAEEIRLLYVAMTRAREQLYICYTAKALPSKLEGLVCCLGTDATLPDGFLTSVNSASAWLLAALLRHPDVACSVCPAALPYVLRDAQGHWSVRLWRDPEAPTASCAPSCDRAPEADPEEVDALRRQMLWQYPYASLAAVPAKCAVSQLAQQMAADQQPHSRFVCPDFTQSEDLSGAERGTAHHLFMQHVRLDGQALSVDSEIQRMTQQRLLSPRQASALNRTRLDTFFRSDLYRRILQAEFYHREVPFTFGLPAAEYPGVAQAVDAEETVVIQGIADAVMGENGDLILIDFKTDRVETEQELCQRYAPQLQLYARALQVLYRRRVAQALLYSFYLGKEIEVQL